MITKLARDFMPEICKEKDFKATFYVADQTEYALRLKDKLIEETQEYLTDETPEELADIIEVVYALAAQHNVSPQKLERIREQKARNRGAFNKKIIIKYPKY